MALNVTLIASPGSWTVIELMSIGTVLVSLSLFCVIGNLFVITAIVLERDLHLPQYYLIFSLAMADLLVGLIVYPLATLNELQRRWTLGMFVCDFWISVDVMLCTASILHLVAIALDRYWSISDIRYMHQRTANRIFAMLALVWVVSLLISVAPIFGWKDADFSRRVTDLQICLISQDLSYQVFSTATAFYIPLIAIVYVYYKIFRTAKKRFKRERDRKRNMLMDRINDDPTMTNNSPSRMEEEDDDEEDEEDEIEEPTKQQHQQQQEKEQKKGVSTLMAEKVGKKQRFRFKIGGKKESPQMKRERKAWKILAIITSTFVACWLPFFLISLYRPICQCPISVVVVSITLWLGYINSAANPIIYTIFSPDFRLAFKRIIKRICFIRG